MKRKIAIIGGGMAGLAAAFDLTRTKALQDQFDVTIYQIGWRLGGKAASGRDCGGRIIEHGLHVWFGCYENAFELVRAAYDEWKPQKGQAIVKPEDAFQAHVRTAIGSGDRVDFFRLDWPPVDGCPGVGDAPPLLWPCIEQLLSVIEKQYNLHAPLVTQVSEFEIAPDIVALMAQAQIPLEFSVWGREQSEAFGPMRVPFAASLAYAPQWAKSLAEQAQLRGQTQLRGFVRFLRMISWHLWREEEFKRQPAGEFLAELIDVGTSLVKGVILDMVLGGASVVELDRLDFREWLLSNGANRESVYSSSVVHSIYDTTMQYCDGDKRRPSFGAGTAAQVSMRLLGTYRGAFAYESRAGLGEVVIAPIYRVLQQRNVQFRFFYKLTRLELNAGRDSIAKIHFDRQVDLRYGTYDPTIPPRPELGNLECWPESPLWHQIKDRDALRGLDLESYWCDQKVCEETLRQGVEFDEAVLAIPIGAFKPLNAAPGPCAELIGASARFNKMTDAASLVPSISVQAWCTDSLERLGWPPPELGLAYGNATDYPTSTGPRPLNIWADRTVVLNYENWDCASVRPVSLQYLCDVLETSLYKEPPNQTEVPKKAACLARRLAVNWFELKSRVLWPLASRYGNFNWNVLFDPEEREGECRIDYQVVKANVDPSACCAGSPAGSTQWRLRADRSGFGHLFLAGAWIDTGFNTECIEAAVMSGKQAARAIAGTGSEIAGENFLHFERGLGALIESLLEDVEALAEAVLSFALRGGEAEVSRRVSRTRQQRHERGS
jgi:uncharacterized protein with NAD-binding domain and iron-sulfur cluster